MRSKLINSNGISLWDYLIVLIIIAISGRTLFFSTNINESYLILYNLFPILFLPILAIYISGKKSYIRAAEEKKLREYYIIYIAIIALSALFNLDFRGGYIITIMFFFTSYLYIRVVPLKTFIIVFEKIIWWITLISVPIFILCFFVPGIRAVVPTVTNSGFNTYANFFVTVVPLWDTDSSLFRMYGPFSEPGVYQIYLNLSLLFHIYINNGQLQLKKAIVYILAVLLTQSTTGYLCLAIVLISYIFRKNRGKSKYKNYFISALIIVAFTILYIRTSLFTAESEVFDKFTNESVSAVSREASITVNAEIFMKSPIFGVGFSSVSSIFEGICKSKYGFSQGISNTNTVLFYFATLGIFFGLLFLYAFYLFCRRFGNNTMTKNLVFISVLLMFSGELMYGCFWVYAFLGYGLLNRKD